MLVVLVLACSAPAEAAVEVIQQRVIPVRQDQVYLDALRAGGVRAIAVNSSDGRCWYAAEWVQCCGGERWDVEHLGLVIVGFSHWSERKPWCPQKCECDCEVLRCNVCEQIAKPHFENMFTNDFRTVADLEVSPTDGSVWVAEPGQVLCLDERRRWQWAVPEVANPRSISINRNDSSCWVANTENHEVLKLSSAGSILWRVGGFNLPTSISVNPTDGTAWVADNANAQVVHLSASGAELWRGGVCPYPIAVAVNEVDGSCWVADPYAHEVIHLAADGTELQRLAVQEPRALAVNPNHGDCWVAAASEVIHLDPDGTHRASYGGISHAPALAVDLNDDTVWVADKNGDRVMCLQTICSPFYDVECWHWALDEIVACYEADVVRGYGTDTGLYCEIVEFYWPTWQVTRDQMAVYIARALAGGDAEVPHPPLEPSFNDIWYSFWAYKYIEFLFEVQVVQGYVDGGYHPSQPVDRGQMAVYIARADVAPQGEEGLEGYTPPDDPTFADVPEIFWAHKHIEYCSENDIVRGYLDGKYHPEFTVTRDQMAVYICRAFNLPVS
jgi:DNA-binding beta-propeller fold protein YncE